MRSTVPQWANLSRQLSQTHEYYGSGWSKLETFAASRGIKARRVHGETDDFSYNIIRDPVHIHDLNATALHLLGIDHKRLTARFQGRDYRLTDVHGEVIQAILS
jgi:Protein of unknown function (DUF1501)